MVTNDEKMFEYYQSIRVKCKYCGHSNTMPVYVHKKICSYCNKMIHNTTKAYFKYNTIKSLRRKKYEEVQEND